MSVYAKNFNIFIIYILCLYQIGCTSSSIKQQTYSEYKVAEAKAYYGSYPDNYEKLIKDWFYNNLKDPMSVQYYCIEKPRKILFPGETIGQYMLTANINAKNSYGGYEGVTSYYFKIRDGVILSAHLGEKLDCK